MSKFFKTSFNNQWLHDDELSVWLAPCPNDRFAFFCKFCQRTVYLSNMGKQAVTSHSKSKKHQQLAKGRNMSYGIGVFLKSNETPQATPSKNNSSQPPQSSDTCKFSRPDICQPSTSNSDLPKESSHTCTEITSKKLTNSESSKPTRGFEAFREKESITKAEIIWSLMSIHTHLSLNTAGKCSEMFKILFPDSNIAKNMQLGRSKMAYTIVYGLGPYFKKSLFDDIDESECFGVSFDESLNKISQAQQMDINVRFWSKTNDEVRVRYLGSAFLGHSTAEDLLCAFKTQISSLNLQKMIHVSMDGPNVNLKFIRLLKEFLKEDDNDPSLMELGTCGLHSLHNAFKTAVKATDWKVVEFLRAIYNVFKNVPARRADFIAATNSNRFPKKFCAIRWLENVEVAERAFELLNHLAKYVSAVKSQPKSDSFETMKSCLNDKMLGPKLAFFKTLSAEVEPFLRQFQDNNPLAPFIYSDLTNILHSLLSKFVKEDVLNSFKNDISKIDLEKESNLICAKKINLGYETRMAIREVSATQLEILQFRQQCLMSLKVMCIRLLNKSPLAFKLTKSLSFCDPAVIVADSSIAFLRLSRCLENFMLNKWIGGGLADKIEKEFKSVCNDATKMHEIKEYKRRTRLDNFWRNILEPKSQPDKKSCLMGFLKKVFVLSHGNAAVERGFSINKECLMENLNQESLVAQRHVWEGINEAGGVCNVEITKSMIQYTRNARSKYHEELARKKKENEEIEKEKQAKKRAAEKLQELSAKRKKIMEESNLQLQVLDEEMRALSKC